MLWNDSNKCILQSDLKPICVYTKNIKIKYKIWNLNWLFLMYIQNYKRPEIFQNTLFYSKQKNRE